MSWRGPSARLALLLAPIALGGAVLWFALSRPPPRRMETNAASARGVEHDVGSDADADECNLRSLRLPNGRPAMLDCGEARALVREVRTRLAAAPHEPDAAAFANAMTGWLDPHGLWSAAPDAPARAKIRKNAARIVAELEGDGSDCVATREVAQVTRDWVVELRSSFARGRERAPRVDRPRALELALGAVYEDDPVTRPARALALDLGQRAESFELAFGSSVRLAVDAADERLLPALGVEDWTRIALAAAVRAYVPLTDAHGQWAPLDEEWSLYAADAAVDPGPKLWGRMMRTVLGVRVLDEPMPPLAKDDLVLSVGGIATAGLSVEQLEQLGRLESVGGETVREVQVVRAGSDAPQKLVVALPDLEEREPPGELSVERVRFGDGVALVVAIPDVSDALGDSLVELVSQLRSGPELPLGILLDLRGNGGGSTDGAAGAIGVFLPGAPSFPVRRRGGAVEVERAITPSDGGAWRGPVASLVDGYTASAAEMIAGALASYGRGGVVGTRTFGKGCIQEYFDDRVGVGVLRLTTMVFALPDGSPLQGVGLAPTLPLSLPRVREREALLDASVPPWRGPDVRDRAQMGGARWPSHRGRVGPCKDRAVCVALERLGDDAVARRTASAVRASPTRPGR